MSLRGARTSANEECFIEGPSCSSGHFEGHKNLSKESWKHFEGRARDFISINSSCPPRADPRQIRALLLDSLAALEHLYSAGELEFCGFETLRDLRSFLELDDEALVRSWRLEDELPDWIGQLRDALHLAGSSLALRSSSLSPSPPPPPSWASGPQELEISKGTCVLSVGFPLQWQTPPVRINPAALPPLPRISQNMYDQIFNSCQGRPLDFLGDALLGHLVARNLHRGFPHLMNGHLTYLRSLLVRNTTLSYIAWHYKFHTFFKYPPSRGELDQKEMADAFEAFLGAVSLESRGELEADAWITALFSPRVFPDAATIVYQIERGPVYPQNSSLVDFRKALTPFRPTLTVEDLKRDVHHAEPVLNMRDVDRRLAALGI